MTQAKTILLVDDDSALRQSLAEQLQLIEGFDTREVATGTAALDAVRRTAFDAVVVDARLPDIDGRELCRRMRGEGMGCPIILLTDDADPGGLDGGASDIVPKPVRLGVLLARLKAQLRQAGADAMRPIGPYQFRPGDKLLVDEARRRTIRLTEKEAAILSFLCRAGDAVVGRDTLLGEVWGYKADVTTHTLETHVYRLRRKIERDPANATILVTEPGGYRLVP